MDDMLYELLLEVNGRMEAEFFKGYLEASGVPVEIFQEAVGHHIYPVTVSGLGSVQLFVPKERLAEARRLLAARNDAT